VRVSGAAGWQLEEGRIAGLCGESCVWLTGVHVLLLCSVRQLPDVRVDMRAEVQSGSVAAHCLTEVLLGLAGRRFAGQHRESR
jgi:hypothetical protein